MTNSEIDRMLQAIEKRMGASVERLMEIAQAELGYERAHIECLIRDTRLFLEHLQALIKYQRELIGLENRQIAELDSGASIREQPIGRVLVTIPANAPIPLAVALPAAFLAAGNDVIVASASAVRQTTAELLSYFASEPAAVRSWQGSVKTAIDELVEGAKVDALYFLGSSAHYAHIAEQCARNGVGLIYEGQGNGVAVVDESANLDSATEAVLKSKLLWNGKMCSAPNAIVVQEDIFDQFQTTFAHHAPEYLLGRSLGELLSPGSAEAIAEAAVQPDIAAILSKHYPALFRAESLQKTFRHELFGPAAYVLPYTEFDDVLRILRGSPYRLQVSLFSENSSAKEKLVSSTRFARYCINMVPSMQNPLLPWGNYGMSGASVVSNFYQKARRRVLVEGER